MRFLRAWTTLVWISFERLLWSSSTLMVMLPLLVCMLFLFYQRYDQPSADAGQQFHAFSRDFVIGIFSLFVIPICAVAYATASIGGDREDKTLLYLLIRPLSRPAILLAKFFATLPLVLGIVMLSFYLFCQFAGEVGQTAFRYYFPAVFFMTIAYTAMFHLFAVVFRHSTIIALIYALFMELLLGNLPGVIKKVAINYYGRSMIYRFGESEGLRPPPPEVFEPIPAGTAEMMLGWLTVGALILAVVIFQRREYHDLT